MRYVIGSVFSIVGTAASFLSFFIGLGLNEQLRDSNLKQSVIFLNWSIAFLVFIVGFLMISLGYVLLELHHMKKQISDSDGKETGTNS